MRNRFLNRLFALVLLLYPLFLRGQNDFVKIDTLNSTIITANRHEGSSNNTRFSPGTRNHIYKISESEQLRSNSLSDFLRTRTAFNIKEYGRGAGSYISLRGTSSSHTAVHWNGLDISLPTLGQTDLSHIPLYFFDDMNIHVGGNSVLYGNGSIGGTITLNSAPRWREGVSGDILLSGGSYSTIFSGGTIRASGKKWESRSSFFFTYSGNSFEFTNNTLPGYPREKLNNASYRNWGALQEIHHKPTDRSLLSLTIYYLDFNREIQPSVSNNDRPETYRSIYDRNLRIAATYRGSAGSRLHYNANLSYSNDYELYEEDVIAADRVQATAEMEYRHKKLSIKTGALSKLTSPDVHSYSAGIKEWNNELFIMANYAVSGRASIAAGVRKSWVTDSGIPLMPSLDLRFKLLERVSGDIVLRLSTSRSTKIPTLNDKYWGGVTNTLRPEIGTTIEGGIDLRLFRSGWQGKAFATLYYTNVTDWIRWLPVGNIWRPFNIARVLSRGVESGVTISGNIDVLKTNFSILYGYNNVVTKESERTNDPTIDKQLSYQPKHNINSNIDLEYKNTGVSLSLQYTGERTTGDIFDILPSYFLADISASHLFSIGRQGQSPAFFKLSGRVRNIFNTDYQSVKFFAMPGRNWDISLQYLF